MKRSASPKRNRDLEKVYPEIDFLARFRRLADAVVNIEHERTGGSEELEFQLLWKTR